MIKWFSRRFGSFDLNHDGFVFVCFYEFQVRRRFTAIFSLYSLFTLVSTGLVCVCHAACTFHLWLNEWMSRSDTISHTEYTDTHEYTKHNSRYKCRFSLIHYILFVCTCNQLHGICTCILTVKLKAKRLQANCDCSAFFYIFFFSLWQSHFILALTIFCAWINLLHAGEIFFSMEFKIIVWTKQNSIKIVTVNFTQCECQWNY